MVRSPNYAYRKACRLLAARDGDHSEALSLLDLAASSGHAEAAMLLGIAHGEGVGFRKSHRRESL